MSENNKMSALLYEQILTIAEQYDSFYIYEEKRIKSQLRNLQAHFPGIEFLYSVKCNPNRDVLNVILKNDVGADAASLGEVKFASSLGLSRDRIYYSAPGKSFRDIREALPLANLVADSLAEIGRISAAAESAAVGDYLKEDGKISAAVGDCREETGKISAGKGDYPAAVCPLKIGLRINPDFTFDSDIGATSKFGIDEQDVSEFLSSGKVPSNIRIAGIHVHVKSQELDCAKLEKYYQNVIRLAEKVEAMLGYQLDYVNLGSGIGIAYPERESEIVTIVGNLCTAADVAAENISMPHLEAGDIVMINNAGAYAAALSPMQFSSQEAPGEFLLGEN